METGTRLAFEAIVLGLRRAGVIHDHTMLVIIDELRTAARCTREELYDHAADQIDRLAGNLQIESQPFGRKNSLGQTITLKQRAS